MKRLIPLFVFLLAGSPAAANPDHVILLHGLARTSKSMIPMEKALTAAGYRVININYDSRSGTIEELSELVIGSAVDLCREQKATVIHFVTHSLGGILVRGYLARHTIPNLGRVVMLAPPNRGSDLTDRLDFIYRTFGPVNGEASWEIGTGPGSIPNILGPAYFPVGIIAGNHTLPFQFIGSLMIPGRDDGRISIERTKLEGMADHIVVRASHPFIMKQPVTVHQTITFLKTGRFDHEPFFSKYALSGFQ